jgi:hypothetical protein
VVPSARTQGYETLLGNVAALIGIVDQFERFSSGARLAIAGQQRMNLAWARSRAGPSVVRLSCACF